MSASVTVCADGHLHLYPVYSLTQAFDRLFRNLTRLTESAPRRPQPEDDREPVRVAFLTDGRNARIFNDIKDRKITLPDGKHEIKISAEQGCLIVVKKGMGPLYLIAGRQIVTRERLEVLALAADIQEDLDGRAVEETIRAVHEHGAIPVLNWAPGKWFFGRGKIVQRLIATCDPDAFLIGDTSLRATLWPFPRLMRMAIDKGFSLVAGSDPLPFPGEEALMGTYGFVYEGGFDPNKPVSSVREIMTRHRTRIQLCGQRSSAIQMLTRLRKNAAAKRTAA